MLPGPLGDPEHSLDSTSTAPTPASANGVQRFWRHPFTQMFARMIAFALFVFLIASAMRWMFPLPKPKSLGDELAGTGWLPWARLARSLFTVCLSYWLMVRLLERRPVSELAPRKLPLHAATGWLTGMGIMFAAAGAMALFGSYSIQGLNPDPSLLVPLAVLGLGPGIAEEIIARGILFRVVEEATGTWFALALSAALFGFGHFANPNATVWSSLAIAIEAGLLLGMAYAFTRSLWFVMGIHAAWNFTQGALLGIPVSGIAVSDSLLESSTQGAKIISGGEFGAEASILALLICVALAAWFTRKALATGRVVPPFWRRRLADGSVPPLRFAEAQRAPVATA